jgi:uncharacterized protein (TIGR03083 family)
MSEDWPRSTRRLVDGANRVAQLLTQAPDESRQIRNSQWTIRDVAAHLATLSDAYEAISSGQPSPYPDVATRAARNQARIAGESGRDLAPLSEHFVAGINRTAENLASGGPEQTYVHAGITGPAPAFLGLVLGEFLVHGDDIARAMRVRWPIAREDALLVVGAITYMAPALVDRESCQNVTATFDTRIRGGTRNTWEFQRGELSVTEGSPTEADVHISVDPVTWLLLGYRRRGLYGEILRGRALSWGKRPWLALRF